MSTEADVLPPERGLVGQVLGRWQAGECADQLARASTSIVRMLSRIIRNRAPVFVEDLPCSGVEVAGP